MMKKQHQKYVKYSETYLVNKTTNIKEHLKS